MSEEAARAFLGRVERDEEFAAQLEGLKDDPRALLSQVRAEGFDADSAEIRAVFLDRYGSELSPEQLAAVAAGDYTAAEEIGILVGLQLGTMVVMTVAVAAL
jgi:predicted ribosomally synthesized peptide with nif11-like leader